MTFTVITIKNVDYHCIIHSNNKSEAINLLKNSVHEDQQLFFSFFCFNIYKMVGNMIIYKSLKTNIGTVVKNPEMLKFVPRHLKTKTNCVSIQLKNYLF